MSETPRNDDEHQFRDPTAPSYDAAPEDPGLEDRPAADVAQDAGSSWGGSTPTERVPSGSTQQLPTPPGGDVPPPPAPPQTPYAAPPAPGAAGGAATGQNPYAQPPYPAQGQVQAGQSGGYGPPPPGYGTPPPGGYGGPPGGYAAPRQMSGNTIALLVVSGLTTLGCGFGIVALVFAIIAATKTDQPAEQAKYTRWGWIAEVAGLAFVVIAVVLVIIFGVAMSSSGSSGGY
jgi:hypothetical protein